MADHIICGSGPPTTAPTELGQHFIDLTNGDAYISIGTTAVGNWKLSGGTGVSFNTFLSMLDTPGVYTDKGNFLVKVKDDETGLEFISGFDLNSSTGLVDGSKITVNSGDPAKFDVEATICIFTDAFSDPSNPVTVIIVYDALEAVTVTNLATAPATELLFLQNGTLEQSSGVALTPSILRSKVSIGSLIHASGVQIDQIIDTYTGAAISIGNTIMDFFLSIGGFNTFGNIFSANGANLNLDKSAGGFLFLGANYKLNRSDPNIVPLDAISGLNFIYAWQDGSGGWNASFGNTDVNVVNWDDNSGGASVPGGVVPNNQYTIQTALISTGNDVLVYFGQTLYATLAGAEAAIRTQIFLTAPDFQGALFRSWIIVMKSTADLSNTSENSFIPARKFDTLD